jgi:N-acetyl-anhydromuramyl-L-alanine amidase AmpD
MRKITEIFIHCSATKPQWMITSTPDQKVAEIRRWHMQENGWKDIGYHFVIDRNGDIVEGRPIERAGAHVRNHNANSIGICLIGGWGGATTDQFEEHFTELQRQALWKLLDDLTPKFPDARIRGHNEVAAKACPCFTVSEFIKNGRRTSTSSPKAQDVQEGSSHSTSIITSIINLLVGLLRK